MSDPNNGGNVDIRAGDGGVRGNGGNVHITGNISGGNARQENTVITYQQFNECLIQLVESHPNMTPENKKKIVDKLKSGINITGSLASFAQFIFEIIKTENL